MGHLDLGQTLLNLRQSTPKTSTASDQTTNPNTLGSLALAGIFQQQRNAKSKEQIAAEYNAKIADLISGKKGPHIPEEMEDIKP